jgi:sugar/nucleoside kinase (ribokinase family)
MNHSNSNSRHGILAGGNWLVDWVKVIDVYPHPEQLANLSGQLQGTGGAPYNVLMNLARSGATFPLYAAGLIGKDAPAEYILQDCRRHKIDTRHLRQTARASTSFTDVMTERKTGRRTFFHYRGANALWRGDDLDFQNIKARIFHFGYFLLLDELDKPDARFGTKAARLLAAAQRAGMKTSVDSVSEDSDRFPTIVSPALKYVDYCFLNEIEGGKITGLKLRGRNGRLNADSVRAAANGLLDLKVRELIVIHFPEGAIARTRDGKELWQPSLKLPADYIKGTAGAGDAFCAGVLLGLHEGWELQRCLRTGVCIAAASLSQPTCTAGVKSLNRSLALARKFGFRS